MTHHEDHDHEHEEGHEGTFAEGQAVRDSHPEEAAHGDFARGQEGTRPGHEERDFAEGQAQAPGEDPRERPHEQHGEHGDFARGQERDD